MKSKSIIICVKILIILSLSFVEAENVIRREKPRTNEGNDFIDSQNTAPDKRCPPCHAAMSAEAGVGRKSKLSMGFTAVVRSAIDSMWANDYREAFACACHHLSTKTNDGFAQSILHSLSLSKIAANILPRKYSAPKAPAGNILGWEILGPINVGKLEVDADTTFLSSERNPERGTTKGTVSDVALFILQMPSNATVYSDLMPAGTVSWQYIKVAKSGEIDLHFGTAWNEVVQGVSSSAAYEYQGWARAVTYVRANGVYTMTCAGAHTVYVRNDNVTRLLIGDVYKSGQITATVDLKAGLVGLVVPLRGLAQGSLYCQLNPMASESIVVYPPRFLPDAVEFADAATRGTGLLMTTVFALPVQNAQSHSLTLEYRLDKPMGFEGEFIVREVRHPVMQDNSLPSSSHQKGGENKKRLGSGATTSPASDAIYGEETQTILSAGQTALLTLEISSAISPNVPLYVPCRKSKPFTLTVLPGRGDPVKVQFEIQCRYSNQSFQISYVDHDNSVTQAAVILPYAFHSPQFVKQARDSSSSGSRKKYNNPPKKTCRTPANGGQCDNISKVRANPITYPVLLTLHGSGIAPSNHADSHKYMHPLKKGDYLFGLEKYFVLAPTRFGAHNWEAIGDLSAWWSISALKRAVDKVRIEYNVSFPLVSTEFAMVSGHSMGGHGAWMNAVNHPDTFSCIAPAAGWIRKEEYSNGNSFFHLDIHNSYVESSLIAIMMDAMSEFHADRFASNLVLNDVHIRVGSVDRTVHPWYSRRMHRLLVQSGVNASIEELLGKQHWWWDTWKENDGGVLNDNKMRDFYDHCFATSSAQQESTLNFINFAISHDSCSAGLYNLWWMNQTAYRQESYPVSGGKKFSNNTSTKRKQKPRINDTDLFATPSDVLSEGEDDSESGRPFWMMHRCHRENLTLSVSNPAMHSGLCGLRILQQFRLFLMSSVQVSCSPPRLESLDNSCFIRTHNVRRLSVDVGFKSAFFGVDQIIVDGVPFQISPTDMPAAGSYITTPSSSRLDSVALSVNDSMIASLFVEFCWSEAHTGTLKPPPPYRCEKQIDPIREKNLVNYGPFRGLYSRPFHIVYGTPSNQAVRMAMKDLAVYLGNAHFAAHGSRVKVLSDLEYRAGNYIKALSLANVLFIGGPTHNKLLKTANSSLDLLEEDTSAKTLLAFIPPDLSFSSTATTFSLRDHVFNASDESIIFTMPISRRQSRHPSSSQSSPSPVLAAAMGGCIHANSAEGYLHMSRLAWPVVPPMVRAPFANYIPDLMVIDGDIWALGLGAVKAAGFWDTDWRLSKTQLYTRF